MFHPSCFLYIHHYDTSGIFINTRKNIFILFLFLFIFYFFSFFFYFYLFNFNLFLFIFLFYFSKKKKKKIINSDAVYFTESYPTHHVTLFSYNTTELKKNWEQNFNDSKTQTQINVAATTTGQIVTIFESYLQSSIYIVLVDKNGTVVNEMQANSVSHGQNLMVLNENAYFCASSSSSNSHYCVGLNILTAKETFSITKPKFVVLLGINGQGNLIFHSQEDQSLLCYNSQSGSLLWNLSISDNYVLSIDNNDNVYYVQDVNHGDRTTSFLVTFSSLSGKVLLNNTIEKDFLFQINPLVHPDQSIILPLSSNSDYAILRKYY